MKKASNITMDELIQAFESGDELKLSQNVWNYT